MAKSDNGGSKTVQNVRKKMEMLIKYEAATTPDSKGRGPSIPRGEAAARRGQPARPGRGPGGKVQPIPEDESATWLSNVSPSAAASGDFSSGEIAMPEQNMAQVMAEKIGMPYKRIEDYDLEGEMAERVRNYVPSQIARERRVLPLEEEVREGRAPILTVAISDPLDTLIVDDLRLMLPEHDISPVVMDEDDIVDAIERHYGIGDENLDDIIASMDQDAEDDELLANRGSEVDIDLEELANSPPVIKLVSLLLMQAIQDKASDLHIEPFSGMLRIRYRVDGVLREIPSPPKSLQIGMISRLKVMANMNIAETRAPQDGRIRLTISGKEIDLRVSSVPTVHGESIVFRVLDKSAMMIGVRQLGFQKEVLDDVIKEAKKPNGIVLVTGPTGSGKTTTLYSILNEIYDPGLKFITTEDPVEYELPGIVQVNINSKVNLTFAACLRSILRQDPDVILVGEIRDVETAQISIQAALTGHMVFSTLHTNSAAGTVTRLVDMGLEPFLLASTLRAVVGQRLVRLNCPNCKEVYIPTDGELEEFAVSREEVEDITFYMGRGCDDCNFQGYKGRLGIFESMIISEEIVELILQGATTDEIHALAVHQGMQTMRSDGWLKICLGATSFEEVARQTPRETEETARQEMESVRRSLKKIESARREREKAEEFGEDDGGEEFTGPQVIEGHQQEQPAGPQTEDDNEEPPALP